MARSRSSGGRRGALAGSGGRAQSGAGAVLKFRRATITVMRGLEANAFGDLSDVGTPLYTGLPGAIAETNDVTFDAATQRQQIIRAVTLVVDAWVDILTTDTLKDEATGLFYLIESIRSKPGAGYYPPQKVLTLRERSGVGVTSD